MCYRNPHYCIIVPPYIVENLAQSENLEVRETPSDSFFLKMPTIR